MIWSTGAFNSVTLHDDGRVTVIRASRIEGMFLHLEFTEAELNALGHALTARQGTGRMGAGTARVRPNTERTPAQ